MFFLYPKNIQNYSEYRVAHTSGQLHRTSNADNCGHGSSPPTSRNGNELSGDKILWSRLIASGPSERRQHELPQLRSKRRQREFIPSRLENVVKEYVAYVFVVCVTTNDAELFLMPSRLKSHIILVLDRLQCVARVNCLVNLIGPPTRVSVEGKSSVCVMCLKHRIIILIIIIISLGEIIFCFVQFEKHHTRTVVIITHYNRIGHVLILKPNFSSHEIINSRCRRFDLLLFAVLAQSVAATVTAVVAVQVVAVPTGRCRLTVTAVVSVQVAACYQP